MRIHSDLSEWEQIPPITLTTKGDLKIQGWERREIEAESDDEDPSVELGEEQIRIDTRSDLTIRVPFDSDLFLKAGGDAYVHQVRGYLEASRVGGDLKLESGNDVTVESVGGDTHIHQVTGNVTLSRTGGNLKLEGANDVQVESVGGDMHIQQVSALSARKVGGNANAIEVDGPITVNAGGDLRIHRSQGEVTGNAGGNANVEASSAAPKIRLNAKGDVRLHLNHEAGAHVRAVCAGDLRIDGQEETLSFNGPGVHSFNVGDGDGSIALVAGGNVTISGASVVGDVRSVNRDFAGFSQDMDRFGEDMGKLGAELGAVGAELGREFGTLGQKIADKVNRQLRKKMEKHKQKSSRRAARAGAKGFAFNVRMPEPPRPPTPSSAQEHAAHEPVSEEERMLILHMVEEGKITADEAEKLLAALEGDYPESQ